LTITYGANYHDSSGPIDHDSGSGTIAKR